MHAKGSLGRLGVLALAAIILSELAAVAGFKLYATDRLATHWQIEVSTVLSELTPDAMRQFQEQFYHPQLGWVFHEKTTAIPYTAFDEAGARADPFMGPAGKIAAYGDSFTFGEEVENDETWPHFLAEALGVRVANYGVAGYGPDQALLRLTEHLEGGRVPEVAILSVLSENIARVVNVWRHAYTGSETLNFKPIVWTDENGPHWRDSPLGSPISVEAVRQAIVASRQYDFWLDYNQLRPARPHFPYLLSALDTAVYLGFRRLRWQDLWQQEAPIQALSAIVDTFVDYSRKYDFVPVLLMIPMAEDLQRREANEAPTYGPVLAEFREKYKRRLIVVDTLDEPFNAALFQLRPFQGHTSAYGNLVISAAVLRQLSQTNSLE